MYRLFTHYFCLQSFSPSVLWNYLLVVGNETLVLTVTSDYSKQESVDRVVVEQQMFATVKHNHKLKPYNLLRILFFIHLFHFSSYPIIYPCLLVSVRVAVSMQINSCNETCTSRTPNVCTRCILWWRMKHRRVAE